MTAKRCAQTATNISRSVAVQGLLGNAKNAVARGGELRKSIKN
jgi:hypothetical protein